MNIKWIGAVLVITGCGCLGFLFAAAQRKETRYLRCFLAALDYMSCELQYHLTPLPDLCRMTGNVCKGGLQKVFMILAEELENQISPNVEQCMLVSLGKIKDLPKLTRNALQDLGAVLGRFDLEGQCKGIKAVEMDTKRVLQMYTDNQDIRLRSYQTLGICAGAAVVILFI